MSVGFQICINLYTPSGQDLVEAHEQTTSQFTDTVHTVMVIYKFTFPRFKATMHWIICWFKNKKIYSNISYGWKWRNIYFVPTLHWVTLIKTSFTVINSKSYCIESDLQRVFKHIGHLKCLWRHCTQNKYNHRSTPRFPEGCKRKNRKKYHFCF